MQTIDTIEMLCFMFASIMAIERHVIAIRKGRAIVKALRFQEDADDNAENSSAQSIFDTGCPVEMVRISEEIWMFTKILGHSLKGFPAPEKLSVVLDLLCGSGDWAIDVAYHYPAMEVAGVDVSDFVVDYARTKAQSQGLKNISFGKVDLTQPFDFSANTFDIVHSRELGCFVRRDQWPAVLQEILRVLRPGGVLRLIGSEQILTASPAVEEVNAHVLRSLWQNGYGYSPMGRSSGIAPVIERLLEQAGFTDIQLVPYVINFSSGKPFYDAVIRNFYVLARLLMPLLQATGLSEQEIDTLYTRAHIEVRSADFCGLNYIYAVYGTKPH